MTRERKRSSLISPAISSAKPKQWSCNRRKQIIWAAGLVLIWSLVGYVFLQSNGMPSLQQLLSYRPQSSIAAALVLLVLFLVKSVDFLIHSGILYALSGLLFPMPAALLLNAAGMLLMSLVPYCLGKNLGSQTADRLREKYPKLGSVENAHGIGAFSLTLLIRCFGIPILPAGLFLGAKRTDSKPYLGASMLGLLPGMLTYTFFGDKVLTTGWQAAAPIAVVHVVMKALSLYLYARVQRRQTNTGAITPGTSGEERCSGTNTGGV